MESNGEHPGPVSSASSIVSPRKDKKHARPTDMQTTPRSGGKKKRAISVHSTDDESSDIDIDNPKNTYAPESSQSKGKRYKPTKTQV